MSSIISLEFSIAKISLFILLISSCNNLFLFSSVILFSRILFLIGSLTSLIIFNILLQLEISLISLISLNKFTNCFSSIFNSVTFPKYSLTASIYSLFKFVKYSIDSFSLFSTDSASPFWISLCSSTVLNSFLQLSNCKIKLYASLTNLSYSLILLLISSKIKLSFFKISLNPKSS